jgi:toxin-antitoxin system PIN domain toxin
VNVWLALTSARHDHNLAALRWLGSSNDARLFFCRFTQVSFLRLLTTRQVMGEEIVSQSRAWATYRRWFEDDRVGFHPEPDAAGLDRQFHRFSVGPHSSPKRWADAYLAAFASVAGLTLVTFDQALARLAPDRALVLGR